MNKIILLVLVAFCVSCGSIGIKPQDCQTLNWYDQGLKDGSVGKDKVLLGKYKEVCAESSVAVNEGQYAKGYITGLKNFCTYDNGYEYGAKGGEPHACPEGTEYKTGYDKGYAKFLDMKERRVLERMTRPSGNSDVGAPMGGETGPSQ